MRIKTSLLLIALLASHLGLCIASAQEVGSKVRLGAGGQESGSKSRIEPEFNTSCRLSNGVHVAFANKTEPPEAIDTVRFAWRSIETDGNDIIHRVFFDAKEGLFFGYDVKAEPVPNTKQIRIIVMPMSSEYERRFMYQAGSQTRSPHPDLKPSSIVQTQTAHLVNEGDLLAIDALINQRTGVKIIEIIKASLFEGIPLGGGSAKATRDFSLDDVELKVINYRLLVNGELIAGDKPTGGCSGAILWFYLPGRGRFIFSIRPHEGYDFQKIGVIENNKLSFAIGEDRFQWISSSPVLQINGPFNLWVLHDADYRPELDDLIGRPVVEGPPRAGLLMGAADKIEYILPKK
jgi:hypothetical protein